MTQHLASQDNVGQHSVLNGALTAWALGAALLLGAAPVAAQDAKGCKDPAMFPQRIPNFSIGSCRSAQDTDTFRWPGGQQQAMGLRWADVEGARLTIDGELGKSAQESRGRVVPIAPSPLTCAPAAVPSRSLWPPRCPVLE